MYTLTRLLPWRQLLLKQGPVLLIAFILAEMFYKFHSFTLECIAFLVTWYVLDAVLNVVMKLFQRPALQPSRLDEH